MSEPAPYYPDGHHNDLQTIRQARAGMPGALGALVDAHDLYGLLEGIDVVAKNVGDVLPAEAYRLGVELGDFIGWTRAQGVG